MEMQNGALFKLYVKVNVRIFKIVGVQEEKREGAGRRSPISFMIFFVITIKEIK